MVYKLLVKTKKKENRVYWQQSGLSGEGGILIVETKEPPVDGRANRSVADQVAEFLKVNISNVKIVSGCKSKYKIIEII